ncbi:MAG: GDP-mannose 4,6-dehydratase, partial [Acidimicrobiales bacterium]
ADTQSLLNPTNPYAASKAGAEHMVNAYFMSYKMPCIIVRANNIYGPKQYPSKIVPKFILNILNDDKCPIHGEGKTTRNFLYVKDAILGILDIWQKGTIGDVYNIGSNEQLSVLEVLQKILSILKPTDTIEEWIEYVPDRKFNDKRYVVNSEEIEKLGWKQTIPFDEGIIKTIGWYKSIDPKVHWHK